MITLQPSYLALLLLAVCAEGVLAVDDVDEMIAVVIFAILIVIFAAIALFFLVMIIRLKREQRDVGDSRKKDIIRTNTKRGDLLSYTDKREPNRLRTLSEGSTNTNPSTLLPISEKEEEEVDIVPSYDKVSDRSSFYENVNGPNPAYQQYNRRGVGGIPINLMKPKQPTEIIKNELYDTEGVTDLEDEPVIVDTTKPPNSSSMPDKGNVKLVSLTSGFVHTCEDADVLPASEYLKMEDVESGEPNKTTGQDMSMFVSTSHTKLDNRVDPGTEGDVSASMDNDSDEVFGPNDATNKAPQQPVGRADSILSTTSDDRDLLNTGKKLKGRQKISYSKPKIFNFASKNTPSPKAKRPKQTSSKPPTADKRDGNKAVSQAATNMAAQQQKSQMMRTDSVESTTSDNRILLDPGKKVKDHPHSKHTIFGNVAAKITPSPKSKRVDLSASKPPTADNKPAQPVAKDTTDEGKKAVPKDTTSDDKKQQQFVSNDTAGDIKKTQQLVPKEHEQATSSTQPKHQQNFKPTVPPMDQKSLPKPNPTVHAWQGSQPAVPSPKLLKHANPRMSPSTRRVAPTTGAYLNTSHPTENNPLAALRAKSSPRVKPRSASPAVQKKVIDKQAQVDSKSTGSGTMATQVTKQQLLAPGPNREIKRSSIATDKPTDDVTDKAAADENRRHTVCNLTFKEKREKETDELDQALKDLNDMITMI